MMDGQQQMLKLYADSSDITHLVSTNFDSCNGVILLLYLYILSSP